MVCNEQKILQAELQDAQLRLEGTLTAAGIGTWTWDIQADRIYADCNFAKMFRVFSRDARGGPLKAYLDAIHPDDLAAVQANIAESLATGKPYQYQFRLRHRDGEIRHIHARRKDEFLAMLAHELRNPLAPISTAAALLGKVNYDTDIVKKYSEIISAARIMRFETVQKYWIAKKY
jgi:PAS domain-containing protein